MAFFHEADRWGSQGFPWSATAASFDRGLFSWNKRAGATGRLYCTLLATMILEVYYRHLPIYGTQSVDDEFRE
jgi:hypothetical protein